MFLVYLNIASGALAATIYAGWVCWWARNRRFGLALVNLVAVLVIVSFTTGYVLMAMNATTIDLSSQWLRPLVPLVLLLPAAAKMLELRHEEHQARKIRFTLDRGLSTRGGRGGGVE